MNVVFSPTNLISYKFCGAAFKAHYFNMFQDLTVLTATSIKIKVLWKMTLCQLVHIYPPK